MATRNIYFEHDDILQICVSNKQIVYVRHKKKDETHQRFQFERHGYFVTDLKGHSAGKTVFNRVAGMKNSWGQ